MLPAFSFTPFLLASYILITWGVCAAVLIGIGALLLRPLVGEHRPQDAFWAGLFVVVALLQVGHFFVPIGPAFAILFGVLGLVGLLLRLKPYFSSAFTKASGRDWDSVVWSLLVTFALALRCVGPCDHYDTGFYGAMAVRWYNTYAIVPGLANLMAQLGFHSSVLLCIAALNHGPWSGLAFHLFGGLLLSALIFAVVPAFRRLWHGETVTMTNGFLALLVIPALFWVTNSEIIGTNTDLPTAFLVLTAFYYLLSALRPKEEETNPGPSRATALLLALLLFPLAVSFKVSTVVFAGLCWLIALTQVWKRRELPQRGRLLAAGAALPVVLVLTWCLRGVILSGYPFFPSSILGMPVDWREPRWVADFQAEGVRSWARMPWWTHAETAGWKWLGPWLQGIMHNRVDFICPALFAVAGIAAVARRRELRGRWMQLLIPCACGLAFWFWKAPAIRFGEFVIWSLAATFGAAVMVCAFPAGSGTIRRAILAGFVVVGIWCSYPRTIWRAFFRPAFEQQVLPRLPEDPVAPYAVNDKLTIQVPFKRNQCWDAALPCSPYFYDSVRLRRDSDLSSGFADPQGAGDFDKSKEFHKRYWKGPEPNPDH